MEKRNSNDKKEDMPLGLGFGLSVNEEAMDHVSHLTDTEKQQVIEAARRVQTKKEMNHLIQDIAKM